MFIQVVGLSTSCDPVNLNKVIGDCVNNVSKYKGLNIDEKKDVIFDVMTQFERDKGKYPVSVYANQCCRNKAKSALRYKYSRIRQNFDMNDKPISDLSLDEMKSRHKDKNDKENPLMSSISVESSDYNMSELLYTVELSAPELVPILKKALLGERLSLSEKRKLRKVISREDILS